MPEQYLGTSADGAKFLSHVGELLDKELGKEGHHDWDGAHAAATIEAELRNPRKTWTEKFAWLNEMTTAISKANRFHNWGIELERFWWRRDMTSNARFLSSSVPQGLPTMLSRSTLDSVMDYLTFYNACTGFYFLTFLFTGRAIQC